MRTVRVRGVTLQGVEAEVVTVEARFEPIDGRRTEVVLSGLPDTIVRESRGRLLSALEENRLRLPQGRLLLHLAPAGVKKSGEALDLPLALGAAAAGGHLPPGAVGKALFLGELGIDGRLQPVPGGLAAAETGRRLGLRTIVAPGPTAEEAACVPGSTALRADTLAEVVRWCATGAGLERVAAPPDEDGPRSGALYESVRGQAAGKRALAVAAAGGHGLLFFGPPGTGKSLLARALGDLVPRPSLEERLEITRVLSALGRWPRGLARERPFRAPHHTTSFAGLVGGGSPPLPGEVTLAHGGTLFLDELPEFRRESLEALRQPLEDGRVLLARAGRRVDLPARFQLVAAMNPCPCGYRGHPNVPCRCSPFDVARYRRRLSGPLLDRVELRVELASPDPGRLLNGDEEGRYAAVAREVEGARRRSLERQGGTTNARLDPARLDRHAPLDTPGRRLVRRATRSWGLSARAIQSVRRVARTLADLAERDLPSAHDVAEALALRAPLDP